MRSTGAEPAGAAPGPVGLRAWIWVVPAAVYLASFGLVARLVVMVDDRGRLPWYVALLALFYLLFTALWLRPRSHPLLLHLTFGVQCVVILALLALEPEFDYVTSFFVLLSYQAALVFSTRTRWAWIGTLMLLTAASLMVTLGALHGLGLALTPLAFTVALPALALASRDLEVARTESQKMVAELEATHRQLEEYAAEASFLGAVEERNRLARELHDSVSQAMFGILLAVRSAQLMSRSDPEGVRVQLEQLQGLTQDALARMRGFIADLRT
ncbi:MAG: hypothetical protein A2133_00400 [Actinobacteria bacterium RBG_16_64_13]|nr:MAG: hypothetical protein A2133_00400 [Actinobacteria bacterium RBG_16_64_13]